MMTATQVQEEVNKVVNRALANLGSGAGTLPNAAAIATVLTNAAAAVTALGTGTTHDRTIQDPGAALNPELP
jgi:hypothetical protein